MIASEATREAHLFCFTVPQLDEHVLALSMPEVLEVTRIDHIAAVPFAPRFVIGLALWRGEIVTMIDLAAALSGSAVSSPAVSGQHAIMQATIGASSHLIAWPILDGSKARGIPKMAARA